MEIIGIYRNKGLSIDIEKRILYEYKELYEDQFIHIYINNKNGKYEYNHKKYDDILLIIGGMFDYDSSLSNDNYSDSNVLTIHKKMNEVYKAFKNKKKIEYYKFNGAYNIILWDINNQKLYMFSDDYACSTIYYQERGDTNIVFSTSLNDLIQIFGKKKISNDSLCEFLRFLDISPPFTIYDGIYCVKPDSTVIYDGVKLYFERKQYNDNNEYNKDGINRLDAVSRYDELLRKSIENKILQKKRNGIFLSGGIDSALLCAIAKDIDPNIKAYSIGFREKKYDESIIAENIAKYIKVDQETFIFSQSEDIDALSEFFSLIPSPFADPAIVPTFQIFKKIRPYVDIVFDGTGADTLMGIMPARHIRFILRYSSKLNYNLRTRFVRLFNSIPLCKRYSDLFDFEDVEELMIRWKGWTKSEIDRLNKKNCNLTYCNFYTEYKEHKNENPYALYNRLIGSLPDDRVHQSGNIMGLNTAFPYFDNDVQKFIKALPMKYRYHKGQAKILSKELLSKYIPKDIWYQKKHGLDYPFIDLLRYRDFELINYYLSKSKNKIHQLFNYNVIKDYKERFITGDHSYGFKIWALIIFQGWYESYYLKANEY